MMMIHRHPELLRLQESLEQCQDCPLGATRRHIVFGRGSEKAGVVLIGEGPGEQEDQEGSPFVGRAGQLLDKILAAAGFGEEDYYICNIVKCRPPQNRAPLPDEVEACKPYLRTQVACIRPKILVLLGATAAKAIIDPQFRITKGRGQWVKKGDFLMMPTFHPAALLRDPAKKAPVWKDFQTIKAEYERICHGRADAGTE